MGTPDFAVESLRALVEGGYNVVAVVTMPDKPAGRGQKMHESDVKLTAKELGLPILQPEKLRDEEFLAGGSFNLSSREKKARVTVRAEYKIKTN